MGIRIDVNYGLSFGTPKPADPPKGTLISGTINDGIGQPQLLSQAIMLNSYVGVRNFRGKTGNGGTGEQSHEAVGKGFCFVISDIPRCQRMTN